MTINITVQRKVMPNKWHLCGNNGCENMVLGRYSVCLKCWIEHLTAHGDQVNQFRYHED